MSSPSPSSFPIVTLSYHELVKFANEDLDDDHRKQLIQKIGQAYGASGKCLGLLAVIDIPDFDAKRQALLPLAPKLATYMSKDDNDDDPLIRPDTMYSVGWSHGKEQLQSGQADYSKGSFYANPLTNDIIASILQREQNNHPQSSQSQDWATKVAAQYPEFYAPNVWPRKEPTLSSLEQAFCDMGQLVVNVGRLVAKVCDAYYQQEGGIGSQPLQLEDTLTRSLNAKGRLLHYFSNTSNYETKKLRDANEDEKKESAENSDKKPSNNMWCGWHNDHGSLTGLVPAMYFNEETGEEVDLSEVLASSHSNGKEQRLPGLYIQARSGDIVHAKLPPNACGFQIGETSQIQSGGVFRATPHGVVGMPHSDSPTMDDPLDKITRATFAVFLEPEFEEVLKIPNGKTVQDCDGSSSKATQAVLPPSIMPLEKRWKPNMTFGEFHTATVTAFLNDKQDVGSTKKS